MADFYGSGRSNYFAVRDEAYFLKWAEALNVEVHGNSDTHTVGNTFMLAATSSDGGFPDPGMTDGDEDETETETEDSREDDYRDILMELSYMLHPETPFVWMQTGSTKLRYLAGVAFAVAPADEINPFAVKTHYRAISIDGIYDMCKEICPHEPTRCEY